MGGAGGSMAQMVNGCDQAMAMDQTGMQKVTINTMGLNYSPKCVKVKAGTDITWKSDFTLHPLVGGTVMNLMKQPDPNSPIKMTKSGNMVTFSFPNAGTYGFYCDNHAASGMAGAVFVE
jgi:plastocyanin